MFSMAVGHARPHAEGGHSAKALRPHLPLALAASLLLNGLLLLVMLLCGYSKPADLPEQLLWGGRRAGGAAHQKRQRFEQQRQQKPPAVPLPSVLAVLARHEEAIRWLDLPKLAAAAQAPHFNLIVYQTPGPEEEEAPPPDVLQAARDAAAAPPDIHIDSEWYSKRWPVRMLPLNRGHESLAYVTAILDHWDNPPDYFAFMHAHRWSYHTHFGRDFVVRALAAHPPALADDTGGYLPLECGERNITWNYLPLDSLSGTAEWMETKGIDEGVDIPGAWSECCERWLGPLPRGLYSLPNAEFVASSAAIHRLPLAFWVGLRDFILSTEQLSFKIGVEMEWLWAYIITGRAIVSPAQPDCMCQLYGLCPPT